MTVSRDTVGDFSHFCPWQPAITVLPGLTALIIWMDKILKLLLKPGRSV